MTHQTEDQLQAQVADWLNLWGVCWWHTPNGAYLGKSKRTAAITAAKLKKAGMKNGVSDCLIAEDWEDPIKGFRGAYTTGHGLAIELKVKGNYPTKEQKEFMADLKARGWRVAVCRSLADVQEACRCLRPLNGRKAPY